MSYHVMRQVPAVAGSRFGASCALVRQARRVLLAGLLVGCGGGESASTDSAAAPAAATPVAARAPGDSTCPNLTGRWDECNVRQRLERAGLAPRRAPAPVRQPIFSVPGISYAVGHAELQVYIYPDSAALGRDVARIDTVRVQARGGGTPIAWAETPTLMTSNNLAAVLVSDNATQVERVRLAMTAGLPAPSTKKK